MLEWLVRHRVKIFLAVGVLYLLTLNGQWRVGRDSAMYRALAHSIASGQGYSYLGEHHDHGYPGLPLMLAGLETIFGTRDPLQSWPEQLMMLLFSGACLVATYHLIRLRFGQINAVVVTLGVAINACFLEEATELLTDMPFALAVCFTLLSFEWLCAARTAGRRALTALLLALGLAVGVATRPTFYALALAMLAGCGWWLLRGRHRAACSIALGVLVTVMAAWYAVDPRRNGSTHQIGGRDERIVTQHITKPSRLVRSSQLEKMLNVEFPTMFFGLRPPRGFAAGISIVLIVSGVLLLRQHVVWGFLVLTTVGMTVSFGSRPRYYIMILPLLILAWLEFLRYVARWAERWRGGANRVMCIGLGIVALPNLVLCGKLVQEQRCITSRGIVPWLEAYDHGSWLPSVNLSAIIKKQVSENQKVIGPSPSVLAFLSERRVYSLTDKFRSVPRRRMADAITAEGFDFAVFPAVLYRRDKLTEKLMDQQFITPQPNAVVYETDGLKLCPIVVGKRSSP